jgi:hypothetical protein
VQVGGRKYIGEEGVVLLVFPVLYLPVAWMFGLLKRKYIGENVRGKEKLILNIAYFAIPFLECVPLVFNPLGTWILYLYILFIILSIISFCVELYCFS